jgi:NADH-quinone oxidoreductase subunit L
VTILGVAVSFALSAYVLYLQMYGGLGTQNISVYTWMVADGIKFEIGFLIDHLTALMMVVVSFVSFMVHIYTIGYMADDPGYQRFFSYIAFFTFSMLMLVMSNNFLQLFFGWEAVGLASYLLIGFWFDRESAAYAGLKAFLVNRVGDFGFLLGIAAVLFCFGTMDYAEVFAAAPSLEGKTVSIIPGLEWQWVTVICICLFIGAMGKSAQAPLHVWLPDSMEGPTPISALIHAATMVTAGIFLVARMSPLFELSAAALNAVLIIGATTAFFMGLLGVVQNDIKRVVAYSTLSQLGYMVVALGVSAYSAAIFHLMTHAFFKALLFLAAGSVIIAMHHEQDMRRMGGLRRHMPVTYWTSLIGSLALVGFPGFSGFFSKDAIIEAVHESALPAAGYAWWAVTLGVFVTALYSFRMFFLVFHGRERMDAHTREHLHESPAVVTVPLVALAVPSVLVGAVAIGPLLFGGFFDGVITVDHDHDVLGHMAEHWHGALAFALHGLTGLPFLLTLAGAGTAWFLFLHRTDLARQLEDRLAAVRGVMVNKYYFDAVYERLFAGGARQFGRALWQVGDVSVIDGAVVNGAARSVGWFSGVVRRVQSGYVYHYAFAMIVGLAALLAWLILRWS